MPIPKYYEMHKPFLEFIRDGQLHTLKELKLQMAAHFRLDEVSLTELLPSGRQTVFVNRIGWARTYLKKAGLIDSPVRATFVITQQGLNVLQNNQDVIDTAYLMRFESFREFQNSGESANTHEGGVADDERGTTPDDAFEGSFKKINDSLC